MVDEEPVPGADLAWRNSIDGSSADVGVAVVIWVSRGIAIMRIYFGIGIVVDDAIMVLENITRHYEEGVSRVEAALVGAKEITGAATRRTLWRDA